MMVESEAEIDMALRSTPNATGSWNGPTEYAARKNEEGL